MSELAAPDPEVDALVALVKARYGERLTPAELAEIEKLVRGQIASAHALRAVRLGNADEPDQPFTPHRDEP